MTMIVANVLFSWFHKVEVIVQCHCKLKSISFNTVLANRFYIASKIVFFLNIVYRI